MLRTMIKEHDHKDNKKATLRKLIYGNSGREASDGLRMENLSDQLSNESSETYDTRSKAQNQSKARERTMRGRSKSRVRKPEYQEIILDSDSEEGSEDTDKDLNMPYKRPKPTPFTIRVTRFKYHQRAKLPRNIKV
ncbi:hypothetical protein Tco_0130304, partial [Tanacetum coccineum]